MVVVVAVELFGQFVDVGPDDRRREILARSGYDRRIFGQRLHQVDLFGQIVGGGSPFEINARLGGLAQDRADTCVGVLDERPRIAVEVDRLAGIEQHRLLGVHL